MFQKQLLILLLVSVLFSGCTIPGSTPGANSTGNISIAQGASTTSTNLTQVIKELQKSVVLINYSGSADDYLFGEGAFSFIGSGVIYSIQGNDVYVLTNRHVVDYNYPDYYSDVKDEKITVKSSDSDYYAAKQRLIAPGRIDLAIIRFTKTGQNLSAVSFADAVPSVGEEVLVIGMPEELEWSVSKGIVSGIRSFDPVGTTSGDKYTAIQTDAAVNSGNSGGGMFLTDGRLVGINTWKYAAYGVEGLNFAISAADFIRLKDAFSDMPLVLSIGNAGAKAGEAASIGITDIIDDYYNPSGSQLNVRLALLDESGRSSPSDGSLNVTIIDDSGITLYNNEFQVKSGDFKAQPGYPFNGKDAYSVSIPYNSINKSKGDYADVVLEFTKNSTTLTKTTYLYLPSELVEGSSSGSNDYGYSGDNGYPDYTPSPSLKTINASAASDGVEIRIAQGGMVDDYYSPYYSMDVEFRNTGNSKKDIRIKDAALVVDGKQHSADFWYDSDKDVGTVYPKASVEKTLDFYDVSSSDSATLYLELGVVEGNTAKTIDINIPFSP